MTTDTLTAEVLEEADRIVRAEWLRLLAAAIPECCHAVHTEMPAARPRPPELAIRNATPERRGAPPPGSPRNRSDTRRRSRRVWPTQRSPPGGYPPDAVRRVMTGGDDPTR
ncbi:hypothetical protein [Mycobacterium sp. pW045]|uniref:hypothetical protein n=1 Tax=Mycobacterium sp. pW045 TaxID=3238984 RepID=UPI00351B288B